MEKNYSPKNPRKKGVNRKSWAPEGYYTFAQALAKIKYLSPSTFKFYVKNKKIPKFVPEFKAGKPRANGYYPIDFIDDLANQYEAMVAIEGGKELMIDEALFEKVVSDRITTRIARPEDEEGIVKILTDRDWPAASPADRRSWLEVNPYLDHVVLSPDEHGDQQVRGYIYAAPFTDQALDDFMNGRKRGKDARAKDHLPYTVGRTYSLYVGIATEEIGKGPNGESLTNPVYGAKLLTGFLGFLQELGRKAVHIRFLYALSDQPHAMEMCERLGFEAYGTTTFYDAPHQHPTQYKLDLEFSQSRFARLYREALT